MSEGRLVIRTELGMCAAYYAHPLTMANAAWLGCIRAPFVEEPERMEAFKALMQKAADDLARQGVIPGPPEPK